MTISAVIFLLQLALDGQYRHTYISENAMMPGQAHTFFRESEWNFVRGYRNEVVNMMNYSLNEKTKAVEELLIGMGYKTNILEYTDPSTGEVKPTLYAIYHVPKGDDTEAMVLATPWNATDGRLNVGALSLTLGLARYFRRMSIWAKNIIIVFPQDGGDALRHWVDAYHTSLENTAGSIESAIVLDNPSSRDHIGYIELEYAGVNGQLPNLDYVNTIVQVAENEGIKVSLNHTPFGQLWTNDFYSRVVALIGGIFDIAGSGIKDFGNAQAFSGWNIQAVTLRAKEGDRNDITSLGRIVESTFRSVNNLLEKFHQSYFFYLLLGPKTFVSIGMYLPAGALTAASFLVASLNAWISGNNTSIDVTSNLKKSLSFKTSQLIYAILTIVILIFSFAIYAYKTTICQNPEDLVYRYFVIPFFIVSLLPLLPIRVRISSDFSRALSMGALFYMGYMLVGLMILNFPLSLILGIITSPLNFVKYSEKMGWRRKLMNTTFLITSCPSVWLIIFGVLQHTHFPLDDVRNLFQYFEYPLLQTEIQKVLDFIESVSLSFWMEGPVELFVGLTQAYKRVQCWTWYYTCLTWFPVWTCLAIVGSFDVYPDTVNVEMDRIKKDQ